MLSSLYVTVRERGHDHNNSEPRPLPPTLRPGVSSRLKPFCGFSRFVVLVGRAARVCWSQAVTTRPRRDPCDG